MLSVNGRAILLRSMDIVIQTLLTGSYRLGQLPLNHTGVTVGGAINPRGMWSLVLTFILFASAVISAAANASNDEASLEIGTIEVIANEVFDGTADEQSFLYRVANRIHAGTREHVIRRELLFESGDPFNQELIEQTERNLRSLRFLRNARVVTTPIDDNGDGQAERVDVRVETWDTWSLEPVIHFRQIDNHSIWKFGLMNRSVLGFGKELTVSRRRNLDRTIDRALYHDPQLLGSRFVLTASAASLSDGAEGSLAIGRPYVSLADPWSVSLTANTFNRMDSLFDNGREVAVLPHHSQSSDFEFGRAVQRRATSAVRMHVAYRSKLDRVGTNVRDFGIVEVGFQSLEHRFTQLTHVNRFEQPEDFNLGAQSWGRIGLSTTAFGGEEGRAIFASAGHSRGFDFGPGHFLMFGGSVGGRHQWGRWSNALAHLRLRYLQKQSTRTAFVGKAEFYRGYNLDDEVQILLGAATGLRGYPVRQFAGTRSLLLTAEERWFIADDVLQLVSLGLAVFMDSGFAWSAQESVDLSDLKTAIGGSLLVGSNRLSSSGSARFDVGYAVNKVTAVGRWVFFAGSDIEF